MNFSLTYATQTKRTDVIVRELGDAQLAHRVTWNAAARYAEGLTTEDEEGVGAWLTYVSERLLVHRGEIARVAACYAAALRREGLV
jgi:hypothetical protein